MSSKTLKIIENILDKKYPQFHWLYTDTHIRFLEARQNILIIRDRFSLALHRYT